MLIKSADNQSQRLQLLEYLLSQPLNRQQKTWLEKQLKMLKTGRQGEKDAAFHLDARYRDNQFSALFHDFRIEVDGEVAQIDHLVVNHLFAILFETKNFNCNVFINEHGEFSVQYPGCNKKGIPSPLDQSQRHARVLGKLFERLDIKSITGRPLRIRHVVLLSPQSIIHRPAVDKFDTRNVIKVDAIERWFQDFINREASVGKVVALAGEVIANMLFNPLSFGGVSDKAMQQHTREIAKHLLSCHVPAPDTLNLPDFLNLKQPFCADCGQAVSVAEYRLCTLYASRFGHQIYCRTHQQTALSRPAESPGKTTFPANALNGKQTQYCNFPDCGLVLDNDIVGYCQRHSARFGGGLYCRQHQKNFASAMSPVIGAANRQTSRPIYCQHPDCEKILSPAVIRYCKNHADQFNGGLYCMVYQRIGFITS